MFLYQSSLYLTMQKQEHRVVLSKNPYLQRTRLKDEFDRFSNLRPAPRPQRRTLEVRPMQNSELEAKLLAVCDSLQAKNVQCKFLIEENEYLNQRLLDLSKGKNDPEKLEVVSEGAVPLGSDKENICCQQLRKELDNAIHLNEQLQRQRRQSAAKTSISTKSIQAVTEELTYRSQESVFRQQVTQLTKQMNKQKTDLEAALEEKNNMIEMLNASLLGAIETSSKLMGEKCELSQKLEQSSNALKEIESLYLNAKQFIFKGMQSSQCSADHHNQSSEEDQTQLDMFKQQLSEKQRDLEAIRYILDVKTKECEQKDQIISSLRNYEAQCGRLEVLARKLAQELMEFKKKPETSGQDKLSRAFSTIQTQVGYCRKAFMFYQTLSSNAAYNKCKAGETIKRRYEEFRNSIAQQFEQICSALIVKKMQIDRFAKELYGELKSQTE